jgi:hypothetical protein
MARARIQSGSAVRVGGAMAFMRGIIAPFGLGRIECRPRLCFQALRVKSAWIGRRAILLRPESARCP